MSEDREAYKAKTPMSQSDLEQGVIKPCPFCGSEAMIEEGDNRLIVSCRGIGCYAQQTCISNKRQEAINKWNERALQVGSMAAFEGKKEGQGNENRRQTRQKEAKG